MSRINRVIYWLQRHRTLARLIHRGLVREWLSRRVWAELEADPDFREGMSRGVADFQAGRFYRYDRGRFTPNPDWPKDGPQPTVPTAGARP